MSGRDTFTNRVAAFYGSAIAQDMQVRASTEGRAPEPKDLHYVLHARDELEAKSMDDFWTNAQRLPSSQFREEDIIFQTG